MIAFLRDQVSELRKARGLNLSEKGRNEYKKLLEEVWEETYRFNS